MFHHPSAGHFDTILPELKQRYNIIPFSQYIDAMDDHTHKLPARSLVLTFDDGWASNYELLPVIEKHRVPVTIFLMAGIMDTKRHPWFSKMTDKNVKQEIKTISDSERVALLKRKGFEETLEFEEPMVMNGTEIRAMQASELVEFASHTLFHPILPRCTDAKAAREISLSKQYIEAITGATCRLLSFPNGEYSERDIRLCKKAGYKAAVTLDVGFNTLNTDPFRLKRISVPDGGSLSELLVKTSGVWAWIKMLTGKQKRNCRHDGL